MSEPLSGSGTAVALGGATVFGLFTGTDFGIVFGAFAGALFVATMPQEISGILVRVPLTLQRKYPDISPSHLDVVKTEIAKASNVAAKAGENVGRWIDDFRRTEGS